MSSTFKNSFVTKYIYIYGDRQTSADVCL